MLRITLLAGADSAQTIKLEGTLLGPWVGEVREACAGAMARSGRTRLDLSAVTFVDAAGVALLRELIRRGVEIAACSGYVTELFGVRGGGAEKMQLLHLDSSPRNERSHSRRLSQLFVARWRERMPACHVVYRDLRVFPLPHVTEDWIAAAFAEPVKRSPQMIQALAISDLLVDELLASDVLVFGVPLYNFGVPSVFKAYIDNVVRVGRTFLFTPEDTAEPYKPLVHGKRMFVVVSSGDAGYAPGGQLNYLNHLEPHVRTIFGFIGIRDISFVYAGNDEFGGERLEQSLRVATEELAALAARAEPSAAPDRGRM